MAVSAWITHVKKYAKDNKIKFGDALKKAGPSYKSSGSTTKKVKKSRGKRSNKGGKSVRKR